ncbi:aminotransferase class I/II-fold pyridoxal phosphate-dependent enzyme [Chryseobacterium sp. P1-3]|uniref:aminotransferase class I/II-fold pyridoxal phosphate-dependent enzyme n=1 Tax=Chryseobacterium sp. (strain P1-3) TaxID=1517683 RepID=UPI000AD42A1B|nr:aminotransferase class I/II-fold pyridoxal phosphate-dependent enzyme [Chryseobacterium sp. P1-3]
MSIDFTTATFKDFENIPGYDIAQRAEYFYEFLEHMKSRGHMNYRLKNTSGANATLNINIANHDKEYISFVSSDYLGFTQHPKVIQAAIEGLEKYGTGTGASPLIGGYFDYHNAIENKIAGFFGRNEDEVVLFTTGYSANSATLQILMQKEDIAILDMGVHASVHEGCAFTNKKNISSQQFGSFGTYFEGI